MVRAACCVLRSSVLRRERKAAQWPVVEQEQDEREGDEHGLGHEAAREQQQREEVET
jgi:hypothetical protein